MSLRDVVLSSPPANMSGGVAITRYIGRTLRRGAEFKRKSRIPRPAGKKTSAAKGLMIGRLSDHALHRYYSKKKKLSHSDTRTQKIIQHIEQTLGIRHVATQFPVAVEFGTHKLKTHVDMIGYKDDKLVVIELKCTQHSLDVHEKLYPLPCGAGKLSNHLPDTEKIHHQLQTAFGVIGLQERVGPKYKVIGRIVVCTEDAVRSYPCDAVFVRKSLFAVYPWESKKIAKVNNSIKLLSLPSEKSAQKIIVDEISQQLKGFTNVVEDAKCGVSFVLSNPRSKKKAAIALLNDPQNMGTTGAKYKKTRLHVLAAAKKNDMMPVVVTKSPEGYIVRRIKRM